MLYTGERLTELAMQSYRGHDWFDKYRNACNSLVTIAEEVDSIPEVETEMQELRDKLAEKQESDEPAAGLADLLDPDLRMPMIIACTLMILQQFSGINAVIFFAAEILKDAGMSNPDLGALLIMLVQLFMTAVALPLLLDFVELRALASSVVVWRPTARLRDAGSGEYVYAGLGDDPFELSKL